MNSLGAAVKEGRGLHKAISWSSYNHELRYEKRSLAIAAATRALPDTDFTKSNLNEIEPSSHHLKVKARSKHANRALLLDVLNSTSGKRESKSYLSRFHAARAPPKRNEKTRSKAVQESAIRQSNGVNLGSLFLEARAVTEHPVFAQTEASKSFIDIVTQSLHVALVVIKSPETLSDDVLKGIGLTLSQLGTLGLSSVVVVGHPSLHSIGSSTTITTAERRRNTTEQADRVVRGIDQHGGWGARRLDSILESSQAGRGPGGVRVVHPKLLLAPLRKGIIPVIAPVGFASEGQNMILVETEDVVLALTRELAGIFQTSAPEDDPTGLIEKHKTTKRQIALDRIIVLDPCGGIPASRDPNGSHVFINLEQEYEDICQELLKLKESKQGEQLDIDPTAKSITSALSLSNRILNFAKIEAIPALESLPTARLVPDVRQIDIHLDSLKLVRDSLAILPPSSSALLTSPEEAAHSTHRSAALPTLGVGTRPQRNPLIHNLLTDKPIFSSSLPRTRLSPSSLPTPSPTTFIKRGMPLTIIPDPRTHPWTPPTASSQPLKFTDPRIDLSRLIHLIEDSFSRPLDVSHYLSRLGSSIAGIIIAGAYEGGAILTWETPPNLPTSLVPGTPAHSARLVPYLDKFAVLKRSQGAGGVADIVFSAMVRECFPQGVVWRSRRDNPVNKWYFERARGTWKIPIRDEGQGWTMFWTTEGVDGERFGDYESVCEGVGTSWADGKKVLD